MTKTNAQFYKEFVQPIVHRIAQICAVRGMNIITVVDDLDGKSIFSMISMDDQVSNQLRLIKMLLESENDLEKFQESFLIFMDGLDELEVKDEILPSA